MKPMLSRMHEVNPYVTQTQKKNAISKEFWNRMKWIMYRTMLGRPNQKCLLDGFTQGVLSLPTSGLLWAPSFSFSSISSARHVMMYSNLVPTTRRRISGRKDNQKYACHPFRLTNRKSTTNAHKYQLGLALGSGPLACCTGR
uniref:Uncharacterized protein n=1 Tax=Opuntia streptacantha TaxID=393608 RepID=A0A7C9A519_OPUST